MVTTPFSSAQFALACFFAHCLASVDGVTIANPCTRDAIREKLFYHPYPLDSGSYVQCTEWGTPLIRRCPALQIWNAEYVTCVDAGGQGGGSSSSSAGGQLPQSGGADSVGQQNGGSQLGTGNDASGMNIKEGEVRKSAGGNNFSWQTFFVVAGASNDQSGRQVVQQQQQQQQQQQSVPAAEQQQYSPNNAHVYTQSQQLPAASAPPSAVVGQGQSSSIASGSSLPSQNTGNEASGLRPINTPPLGFYKSYWKSRWMAGGLMNPTGANAEGGSMTDGTTSSLNPCNQANARYFPHPSNPNFYYECVGLRAAERMCPRDQIWSQDRGQCITSSFTGSVNPCTGVTPQTNGNTIVLPFPGDWSKYIVCYDATRFQTVSCPAGQMWNGQGPQCIVSASSVTVSPSSAAGGQTGLDVCAAASSSKSSSSPASSFYHAYSPDPSRFLQCDEFGNVYLRYCGPNKLWKEEFKTCVGGNNVSTSVSSSSSSSAAAEQQSVSASDVASAGSGPPTSPLAGVGGVAAGATGGSSAVLNSGFTGQVGTSVGGVGGQSAGVSGNAGSSVSTQTIVVTEVFRIVCPHGYKFSVDTGVCYLQQTDSGSAAGSASSSASCPPNFEWSAQLLLCVQRFTGTISSSGGSGSQRGAGEFGASPFLSGGISSSGSINSSISSTSGGNATLAGSSSTAVPALPAGANPCGRVAVGTISGFYFPFPGSSAFFIQCDATGIAFVQACPPGLLWDQDLTTCVRRPEVYQSPPAGQESSSLTVNASVSGNVSAAVLNDLTSTDFGDSQSNGIRPAGQVDPCSLPSSNGKYFAHRANPAAFVQCDNGVARVQNCPVHMIWNQNLLTCTVSANVS